MNIGRQLLGCLALVLVGGCASRLHPRPDPTPATGFALAPVAGAPPGVTAFVNVGVVPMASEQVQMLEHQTVLVEGGRISALGPASDIPVPDGAQRIDGRGKYLIPGLADCHAHLASGWSSFTPLLRSLADSVMVEHRLFLWLASGMTTIRNMDHSVRFPMGGNTGLLRLRARAAAGELWSPRIYTAGMLSGPDGGPLLLRDVAPAVAAYKAAGFDFIKIHQQFNHGAVYDSLVAMARHEGIPVEGHVNGVTTLERALQDYRSIEHLTGYREAAALRDSAGNVHTESLGGVLFDPNRVTALARATQRAGVWNCPTLHNGMAGSDKAFNPLMLRVLQREGARLLLGSDGIMLPRMSHPEEETMDGDKLLDEIYGNADAIHDELATIVEAGLTPYQALATGTRNVAAFFGTLDESGTIELGKRADLLLLNGNPLQDISRTRHAAGVMIGGRWLDRATIDRRVANIKAWLVRRCPFMSWPNGNKLSC